MSFFKNTWGYGINFEYYEHRRDISDFMPRNLERYLKPHSTKYFNFNDDLKNWLTLKVSQFHLHIY